MEWEGSDRSPQGLDPSLPSRLWEPRGSLGSHRSNQVSISQNAIPPGSKEEGGLEEDTGLVPTEDALALDLYLEQR